MQHSITLSKTTTTITATTTIISVELEKKEFCISIDKCTIFVFVCHDTKIKSFIHSIIIMIIMIIIIIISSSSSITWINMAPFM